MEFRIGDVEINLTELESCERQMAANRRTRGDAENLEAKIESALNTYDDLDEYLDRMRSLRLTDNPPVIDDDSQFCAEPLILANGGPKEGENCSSEEATSAVKRLSFVQLLYIFMSILSIANLFYSKGKWIVFTNLLFNEDFYIKRNNFNR